VGLFAAYPKPSRIRCKDVNLVLRCMPNAHVGGQPSPCYLDPKTGRVTEFRYRIPAEGIPLHLRLREAASVAHLDRASHPS
jgi:hypothetical protein